MQTSRFQLGLMASLATGLGFSLSSSDAIGYPSGPVISAGQNPIVSATGHIELATRTAHVPGVLTAPDDQDLIITDVVVGVLQDGEACRATGHFEVVDSEGVSLANVAVQNPYLVNAAGSPIQLSLDSGIRVSAGRSVDVKWEFKYNYCSYSAYDVDWVLSGYHAAR